MQSICVFCGSSAGENPVYVDAARSLGKLLVQEKIQLVYGGGSIGLMGTIADQVMESGGEVLGVIPRFLDDLEVGHKSITELILVDSMHERKTKMEHLSEGVIAMPGGFGTMEELTEMLTWAQLKLVKKPIGLLNTHGYYDAFLRFVDHMVDEGFLKAHNRELLISDHSPEGLLQKMRDFDPSKGSRKMKWDQT